MAKTRRRFSAEFKSKVALEALKENKTMAELTQEYGVQSVQIKEWKQHLCCVYPWQVPGDIHPHNGIG